MVDTTSIFLFKAEESLAGAESEFVNGRYNNCANRCYYACFLAAIHALSEAGIRPTGREAQWGHAFVQGQFAGELINRRKRYSADLRSTISRNLLLRQTADYEDDYVGKTEVGRALRRTRDFVTAIRTKGGRTK